MGSFPEFVAHLREHDDRATGRFVKDYRPFIIQFIGHRLSRLGLSSLIDPEDIAQDVFAKFFAKVLERFEPQSSEELIKLLITMTKDQIIDYGRYFQAVRRGCGKAAKQKAHSGEIGSRSDEPGQNLVEKEQLIEIHQLMSNEEWDLVYSRASGQGWGELAKKYGKNAEALRKKFKRALIRLRHRLNPEE